MYNTDWHQFPYAKHQYWKLLITTRVAPNLTSSNSAEAEFGRISELKFGRSRIWLKLVFWSHYNTPVIKLMASTMLSAAIEAVHFSASFVAYYCLPVIDKMCRIAMNQFCILNYFSSILTYDWFIIMLHVVVPVCLHYCSITCLLLLRG